MITLKEIKKNKKIKELIAFADRSLEQIGYTEHGFRHSRIVAKWAGQLLRELDFDKRRIQLAEIGGYLHDIGNVINRRNHAQHSGHIVMQILPEIGMDFSEVIEIASAIGNHHEGEGDMVSDIGSAIVLADKADVHLSRVRDAKNVSYDIHDRVNFAVRDSKLIVAEKDTIEITILIDPYISSVMEYFEIFLERMMVCQRAALFLDKKFELVINGVRLT